MIPVRGSGDSCHAKDDRTIRCIHDEDQFYSYSLSLSSQQVADIFELMMIPAW